MVGMYRNWSNSPPPTEGVSAHHCTKELSILPSASSQRYGLNSLSFRGSLLWNTIGDEIKWSPFLEKFQKGNT